MSNNKLQLLNYLLLFIAFLLQTNLMFSQCDENIILNGSFTSNTGNSTVAPYWEGTISPDVNDASGELNTASTQYEWTGEILSSSNGGTWQNIFGPETIFQFVELEVGKPYDICIEYAAQGIGASPILTFDQPVGVNFIINDTIVYTTSKDETQYTWEKDCIILIATKAINKIEFQPDEEQYIGIDGVCLTENLTSSTKVIKEKKEHYIYPNPIIRNGQLTLRSTIKKPFSLEVFSYNGGVIFKENNIITEEFVIPVQISVSGIYFYTIEYENHKTISGTFTVK